MADTVKTRAIKAIEKAIGEIEGINGVFRNPAMEVQRETGTFPIVFVYDTEEKKVQVNRYAQVTVPVRIELWNEGEEAGFLDSEDELVAEIEKKLLSDENVRLWCRRIRPSPERSSSKFMGEEHMGGIVMWWEIEFHHIWGDPYNAGR